VMLGGPRKIIEINESLLVKVQHHKASALKRAQCGCYV
jgi:hypothetical protein